MQCIVRKVRLIKLSALLFTYAKIQNQNDTMVILTLAMFFEAISAGIPTTTRTRNGLGSTLLLRDITIFKIISLTNGLAFHIKADE